MSYRNEPKKITRAERSHLRSIRGHAAKQRQADQDNWRASKGFDLVAFNAGAEKRFIAWLTAKLIKAKDNALPLIWVFSNAAYDLDVSVATVKRYMMKFTADRAPFASDGKTIQLRALQHPQSRGLVSRNNKAKAPRK